MKSKVCIILIVIMLCVLHSNLFAVMLDKKPYNNFLFTSSDLPAFQEFSSFTDTSNFFKEPQPQTDILNTNLFSIAYQTSTAREDGLARFINLGLAYKIYENTLEVRSNLYIPINQFAYDYGWGVGISLNYYFEKSKYFDMYLGIGFDMFRGKENNEQKMIPGVGFSFGYNYKVKGISLDFGGKMIWNSRGFEPHIVIGISVPIK